MKKPKTKEEMLKVIYSLEHRERVIFALNKDHCNDSNAVCEIYGALDFNSSMFEDQFNITVTFADTCGKWIKGNPRRTMKRRLIKQHGSDFMEKLFNAIGEKQCTK